MLEHGGGLRVAAEQYGIPLSDWLDLSTGINPQGWPVTPVPGTVWQRLPEADDGLEAAAAAYYGAESLLPVAGSQAAIQALPRLRALGRIGVLSPSYAEHAHAWRRAGHQVELLSADRLDTAIAQLDTLVLAHPNNPTGVRFPVDALLDWRARLAARGGWLVVDEAFMDATPEDSLAGQTGLPGLIVLRSLGKFFGLAGARVGFALAEPALLLGIVAVVRATGEMSLASALGAASPGLWAGSGIAPALVFLAWLAVFLAENSRIPVDDPNTHLELTMIHEVMVLDHGGPDFAFVLLGAALKMWILGAFLVGLLAPLSTGNTLLDIGAGLAGMLVLAVVVGAVESTMARLRLLRVPHLLLTAGAFSILALLLVAR